MTKFTLLSMPLAMSIALVLGGCATTDTEFRPESTRLRKPDRILVYPFAASASDLTPEERAEFVGDPMTPPSREQRAAGRELGAKVAVRLVEQINNMGMRAVVAGSTTPVQVGDIVVRGHFQSIDEGSATKRFAIGFGSGKAELRTVVTAYVMTNSGLRRVGGGTVDSSGGKGPGLFVPIIVTAATANPIGLVVGAAAKVEGQVSGRTTIDGAAKRTADAIADRMKTRFQE